ncbi:hypothetical protein GE061_008196 [Apolygus lucorum]|uniref:Uncharacterized protein n=1 Tax=Apolygus lucorum TaxID=248454 RepID=A0A8S9WQP0_APOLU|nr:hypothetical protein GE061_008196 [Apolygus lucorum]
MTAEAEVERLQSSSEGRINTALPAGNPLEKLEEVASLLRYATCSEMMAVRVASGRAAMEGLLELARWIPTYQRVAMERDALIERQARWVEERELLRQDREAAWDMLDEITARGPPESPAAQTVDPVPSEQRAVEPTAARTTEAATPVMEVSPSRPEFSPMTPSRQRSSPPSPSSPAQTGSKRATRTLSVTPPNRSRSNTPDRIESPEWFPAARPEPQLLLRDIGAATARPSLLIRLTRKSKKRTLACLLKPY